MRKVFLATLLFGFAAWFCPQQKAEAFEPVTMSLLAPMALEAAQTAAPIIIKWLSNVGVVFVKMGKDTVEIFLLPIGICEVIFGSPFGYKYFWQGLRFTGKGALAPFKLCFHTFLLPVALFGVPVH